MKTHKEKPREGGGGPCSEPRMTSTAGSARGWRRRAAPRHVSGGPRPRQHPGLGFGLQTERGRWSGVVSRSVCGTVLAARENYTGGKRLYPSNTALTCLAPILNVQAL